MVNAAQTTTFMDFPDFIVPGGMPIGKISEKVNEIDDRLSLNQEKLEDIKTKKHNGIAPETGSPGSAAFNTITRKIAELASEKRSLYENNQQYQWARQFMNASINYSNYCFNAWDERMYQYMDSRVVESNFAHITDLYSGEFNKTAPAEIRQVNQIPAIINRIMGEADSMGLKYGISVVNTDAINDKLDEYAEKTADVVTKWKRQKGNVQSYLGAPLEDSDAWESEMPELSTLNFTNYKMDKEIMVKRGLDYLMKNPHLAIKYKLSHQALRNYIGTGKMCVKIWDAIDDPDIKSIDSRNLIYLLSPSSNFIQDGMMAGEWFQETPQGIIDMCPEMPADEIVRLRDLASRWAAGNASPTFISRTGDVYVRSQTTITPLYLNCWHLNWRATKRLRVQVIENKFDLDNPHIKFVDDKANDKGALYAYKYVDEIWEGMRIATDFFYQMRPIPNQHIIGDYAERKTLNFVGIIDPNPSLGQLTMPFEALRMEVFYTLERLFAQARPDIIAVDEASESDTADNAYNMHVMGTFRYNSAKEGDMQLAGLNGAKQINKPEVLKMGLSNTINDLLRFLAFLDNCVGNMTGITGARKGELKSDTGMGQMEQANMASSMSTQPYFTIYYTVAGMVLEKLCEQMQRTWAGKDVVKYFMGESGYELLNLMSASEWNLPRYGIFVENAANDQQIQARIYDMAQKILPVVQEPDLALALIKILQADSAQESVRIFEKGIESLKKAKEKAGQQEQQSEQAKEQAMQAAEDAKNMREKIKASATTGAAQITVDGKLQETEMKLTNKGQLADSKKKDTLDLMIAEFELEHKKDAKLQE